MRMMMMSWRVRGRRNSVPGHADKILLCRAQSPMPVGPISIASQGSCTVLYTDALDPDSPLRHSRRESFPWLFLPFTLPFPSSAQGWGCPSWRSLRICILHYSTVWYHAINASNAFLYRSYKLCLIATTPPSSFFTSFSNSLSYTRSMATLYYR
jgi:hypothetical protein